MRKVKKKAKKRKNFEKEKKIHVVGLIFEMNNTKLFGERKETIKIKNKNKFYNKKLKSKFRKKIKRKKI